MVTTNTSQMRNGKPKRGGKQGKAASEKRSKDAPAAVEPDRHVRSSAEESQGGPEVDRTPARVGTGAAARRIRGLADMSESIDVRRRLRRLARQVDRGSQDVQHMSLIEGAIGDCLDDAAATQVDRERWLLCEAATWSLAWMARTRRAGGSAGPLRPQ